jgi:signal transduction histidine kinase
MSDNASASILVLDDEPAIRLVLVEVLSDAGYRVSPAAAAAEALQLLDQTPFDLVISDIVMPEMSGTEFLKRARSAAPEVEVILITGLPDTASAIEAVRGGAFDYIVKPFTPDMIRTRVSAALERAKLRRENRRYRLELERLVEERTQEIELLSERLVRDQEEAISYVSSELHDDLGQSLLALKMSLQSIHAAAGSQKAELAEALEYLNRIIYRCRELSHNLSPAALARLGLPQALRELGREVQKTSGLEVVADVDELEDFFPGNWNIHLYRIAQEAAANAVKHARATRIRFLASRDSGRMHFSVVDNGQGLSQSDGHGIGLVLMRQRAKVLGARLRIESEPSGAAVHVEF